MLNGDQTSDPLTGRCLFTPWDTAALCFCIHPFFLLLSLCRRVVVKINWLQVICPRPDPVESVCRPSPKAVKAKSRQSTYTHTARILLVNAGKMLKRWRTGCKERIDILSGNVESRLLKKLVSLSVSSTTALLRSESVVECSIYLLFLIWNITKCDHIQAGVCACCTYIASCRTKCVL